MKYSAYGESSPEPLKKGDLLISFRGDEYTYVGTYHPRKVTVATKDGFTRDFYANVFEAGIFCDTTGYWTFTPDWPKTDM